MTAAKVINVIARLQNCDGQVADAVSAYTQAMMENAPRLIPIADASSTTQMTQKKFKH